MKSEIRSLKADAAIKNNEIIGLKSALASQSSNSVTKRNLQDINFDTNSTCEPLIEECTKILPTPTDIDITDINYQDNRIFTPDCVENCVTVNGDLVNDIDINNVTFKFEANPEFDFSSDQLEVQVSFPDATIAYTDNSKFTSGCLENCNTDIYYTFTFDGPEEGFDALVRSIVQDELKKNEDGFDALVRSIVQDELKKNEQDTCANIESRKSCIKQSACKWNGLLGCISGNGKSGGGGKTGKNKKGRGYGH